MRALLILSLTFASVHSRAQAPIYPSPQAAFDGGFKAIQNKNYRLFVDSLTDDSQTLFAGAMVMVAGMVTAFAKMDQHPKPEQKATIQKLTNVFNKHGLTEQYLNSQANMKPPASKKRADIVAALSGILRPVKDKRAFLTELLAAMDSLPGQKGFSTDMSGARLSNLKVTGPHATGQIAFTKAGKKPDPIAFKREGPGWKIELPESALGKMGGGGPPRR